MRLPHEPLGTPHLHEITVENLDSNPMTYHTCRLSPAACRAEFTLTETPCTRLTVLVTPKTTPTQQNSRAAPGAV